MAAKRRREIRLAAIPRDLRCACHAHAVVLQRLGGPLYSTATAVAAIAAGIAILAATAYARSRRTARPADIAPLATTSAGRG